MIEYRLNNYEGKDLKNQSPKVHSLSLSPAQKCRRASGLLQNLLVRITAQDVSGE